MYVTMSALIVVLNSVRGSLRGFRRVRVSAGLCGGPRDFSEGSDPIPVTLGNCWTKLG